MAAGLEKAVAAKTTAGGREERVVAGADAVPRGRTSTGSSAMVVVGPGCHSQARLWKTRAAARAAAAAAAYAAAGESAALQPAAGQTAADAGAVARRAQAPGGRIVSAIAAAFAVAPTVVDECIRRRGFG